MTPKQEKKLQRLLREYLDRRWYCQGNEQRFYFDTQYDRTIFIAQLDQLDAVYHAYESPSTYKVDVYLDGKNPYASEQDQV